MTVLGLYVMIVLPVIALLMGWGALRMNHASWKREEASEQARKGASASASSGL